MASLPLDYITRQITDSIAVKQAMLADAELMAQLQAVADLLVDTYRRGGKTLLAGNGGSAADAQHIAAELVSRFAFDRAALPSMALTTDTSILTAIGNDYGYDNLFSRQLEASAREGDVFIAISTSGNSSNILHALHAAKRLRLQRIGLTGASGGKMAALCDHCIRVPSDETPRIQEGHITMGHIFCAYIEQSLFGR